MVKIMTPLTAKYYDECIIEMPSGHIVEALIAKDGLIFILPESVAPELTLAHPWQDAGGWYFNSTRDRYIAEWDVDGIAVNPSFIRKHCTVAI